jgi:Ulp1 family protease
MSLEQRDHVKVKRILKPLVIGDVDEAFMPVFVNGRHWLLIWISVKEQCLHVNDSLDLKHTVIEICMLDSLSQVLSINVKWSTNNHV